MFLGICTIFSDALGPFLTISAAGHAGVPHIHDGASLGPRRAPWRVLWALKVAKAGNNHGVDFRGVIAEQDNGKPHVSHFSVRSNTVTTIASNFPRSYSYGHYYACVDHCYTCVVMMYMRLCVMCVLRVRVRVCTGLSMTHASTRLLRVEKDTYSTCTVSIFFIFIYTGEEMALPPPRR